jgi:hypothetical protein
MMTLDNEEQWGWSLTSGIDDHLAEMDALIKENRQTTVSEIELNGSAFAIVHDVLSYHKVCAHWVSL